MSLITALILSTLTVAEAASPKAGSSCPKVGIKEVSKGKTFTCVKSGKKLVWNKGVVVAAPKPSPTPTPSPSPVISASPTPEPTQSPSLAPTPSATTRPSISPIPSQTPIPTPTPKSFEDLFENRLGISVTAWKKSSEVIQATKAKFGTLEIYTGPNTKPYFDDYPAAVSLVSRLFPGRAEPEKTIVIRFNYKDLEWAEGITREKISPNDYDQIQRRENNQFVSANCESSSSNCRGARQQTGNSGVSIIMQGVENQLDANDPTAKLRSYSGMTEAHEYFHALQRIPIMGKSSVWPHAWFREGSAHWVQNATINNSDFAKYQDFLRLSCNPLCIRLSEAEIAEFLEKSNGESAGPKFDRWLNYSLGSHFVEALVAIKGPDTLIEMYAQMGTGKNFAEAFRNVYRVEWSYAIPILAKTIYANLNGL